VRERLAGDFVTLGGMQAASRNKTLLVDRFI
jgi:hypothetical protein